MIEARRDHEGILAKLAELVRLTRDFGYASPRRWAEWARGGSEARTTTDREWWRLLEDLARYKIPHEPTTVGRVDPASDEEPVATAIVMQCTELDLEDYVPRFKRCSRGRECASPDGPILPARAPREGRPRDPARCAFYRDRSKPDGLQSRCVACVACCAASRDFPVQLSPGVLSTPSSIRRGAIRAKRQVPRDRTAALRKSRKAQPQEQRACANWLRRGVAAGRIARPEPCACGGRWRPVYAERTPGQRRIKGWTCERCGARVNEANGAKR